MMFLTETGNSLKVKELRELMLRCTVNCYGAARF